MQVTCARHMCAFQELVFHLSPSIINIITIMKTTANRLEHIKLLKSFPSNDRGVVEVIDVETIDRLAAWVIIKGRTYIIDEESVVKVPRMQGRQRKGKEK